MHLSMDETIMKSDIIGLPESWIWDEEVTTNLEIEGFVSHHNAIGRGRGLTVYYKQSKFRHVQDIKEDRIQLTKLKGKMENRVETTKLQKYSDVPANMCLPKEHIYRPYKFKIIKPK